MLIPELSNRELHHSTIFNDEAIHSGPVCGDAVHHNYFKGTPPPAQ